MGKVANLGCSKLVQNKVEILAKCPSSTVITQISPTESDD